MSAGAVQVQRWSCCWTASDGVAVGVGSTPDEAIRDLRVARRRDELLKLVMAEAAARGPGAVDRSADPQSPGVGTEQSARDRLLGLAGEIDRILPLLYGKRMCFTLLACEFGLGTGADWISNGSLSDTATGFAEFLGKQDPALIAEVWGRLLHQGVLGPGAERAH